MGLINLDIYIKLECKLNKSKKFVTEFKEKMFVLWTFSITKNTRPILGVERKKLKTSEKYVEKKRD